MNGHTSTSKDLTNIINIIPPKLIKNYDVFIVLKPKDKDNYKIEETDLIDFDTDTVSSKKCDAIPKTEEENQKDLNIIDLFENIAVNPSTFSFQNKSIDEVVFDPLKLKKSNETSYKCDSNDKYAVFKDLENTNIDFGLGTASNSIISIETHRRDYSLENFDLNEDFDFPKLKLTHEADEDLIDEVLSTNVQRISVNNDRYGFNINLNKTNTHDANYEEKSGSQSTSDNENNFDIPIFKRTNRQVSLIPELQVNKHNNLGAIPKNSKVELKTQVSLPLNKEANYVTPKINKLESNSTIKRDDLKNYELPKEIFEKPESAEQIKHHIDHLLKSKTKYCNLLNYYNPKDFYTTLHTNEIEFLVETIQLDAKKYRQRRISVEDSVLKTYTKGPDLYEKKLVLPQIMDRLLNKKKRMEKCAGYKPKLILDCGSLSKKDIPVKFNPVILTEDCNKDRLRNLLMRQNFDRFVTGKFD